MKNLYFQTSWMIIIPLLLFLLAKMLLSINYWWPLVVIYIIVWSYKAMFGDTQEIQEVLRNSGAVLILLLVLSKGLSLEFINQSLQYQIIIPLLGLSLICYFICVIRGTKHTLTY